MMQWSGWGAASGWVWFLGAAALVIVALWLLSRIRPPADGGDEAAAILADRLARGEIDSVEYAGIRAVIGWSVHSSVDSSFDSSGNVRRIVRANLGNLSGNTSGKLGTPRRFGWFSACCGASRRRPTGITVRGSR